MDIGLSSGKGLHGTIAAGFLTIPSTYRKFWVTLTQALDAKDKGNASPLKRAVLFRGIAALVRIYIRQTKVLTPGGVGISNLPEKSFNGVISGLLEAQSYNC